MGILLAFVGVGFGCFVAGIVIASVRLRIQFAELRFEKQALTERIVQLTLERDELEQQLAMPYLDPDSVSDVLRDVQVGPRISADLQ